MSKDKTQDVLMKTEMQLFTCEYRCCQRKQISSDARVWQPRVYLLSALLVRIPVRACRRMKKHSFRRRARWVKQIVKWDVSYPNRAVFGSEASGKGASCNVIQTPLGQVGSGDPVTFNFSATIRLALACFTSSGAFASKRVYNSVACQTLITMTRSKPYVPTFMQRFRLW